jgi:hypothetical protein
MEQARPGVSGRGDLNAYTVFIASTRSGIARTEVSVPAWRTTSVAVPAGSSTYGVAWPSAMLLNRIGPPSTAISTFARMGEAWIKRARGEPRVTVAVPYPTACPAPRAPGHSPAPPTSGRIHLESRQASITMRVGPGAERRAMLHCTVCRRPFVVAAHQHQAQYCSPRCRSTAQKQAHRRKVKERTRS